jgi:AraC-like DNA-binding protein
MNVKSLHQAERDTQRIQTSRTELIERMVSVLPEDGSVEPLPGLSLARRSAPQEPLHGLFKPTLCVIAQGSKEVLLGDSRYRYDPLHYLLVTVNLPTVTQVLQASNEQPYLSFSMELSPTLVSSVMVELGYNLDPGPTEAKAIDVSPLDANLLDAVVRLVRGIESPTEARILTPLILREIIYRLLIGDQRGRLCHLALSGGYASDIAKAVEWLRQNFDQPIRVEEIAHELGMSVSGFHRHFKAVTAISPLQFQKQLRVQEARRLMLSENLDAASAAYRVGYNDAAHFNREYKSVFGSPPMRDIHRLREIATRPLAL